MSELVDSIRRNFGSGDTKLSAAKACNDEECAFFKSFL